MYSHAILLERIQLALLRGAAIALALFASVWIWHRLISNQDVIPWTVYTVPSIILALLVTVVMWNTPAKDPLSPGLGTWLSIIKSVLLVTAMVIAISFFYRADSYSRGTLLVFVPVASVALYAAAVVHLGLLRAITRNSEATRRVVVVGMGEHGLRIARALLRQPAYYSVVGFLADGDPEIYRDLGLAHLGPVDALDDVLESTDIAVAMIALPEFDEERSQEAIGVCMARGVEWKVMPPMLDLVVDNVEFEYVDGLPLVGRRTSRLVGYNWYVKRSIDIFASTILLVLLSPVLAVAWVAIRLSSPGPAIFRQQRLGLHSKPFTLRKFRTMRIETSSDGHQAATAQWILGNSIESEGTSEDDREAGLYKIANDGRITKVGGVLRKTSIDELPQLWNVLIGDMSLVGPRPPIEYEVARYTEHHKRRLDVPPGVTGLWQVSGRNKLSFDEMVDLDIAYIEQWTLTLDIEILLRTIPAVVSDRGY